MVYEAAARQDIAYQSDLFPLNGDSPNAMRYSANCDTVCGANERKESQVKQAGQQERALANCNLMQVICSTTNIRRAYKRVKQNKGAAGIAKWGWVNLQTGLRTKGGESHQILKPVRKFTTTTGDEQELV